MLLTLADQLSDIGIGTVPPHEQPDRPKALSPDDEQEYHEKHQKILLERVVEILEKNKTYVGKDGKTCGFSSSLDAIIKITVDKQHHQHLNVRQYRVADALVAATTACPQVVRE